MVGFCIASFSCTHIVMPWLPERHHNRARRSLCEYCSAILCHVFVRSEPVSLCCSTHFPFKSSYEGRKALRSKEETASSVFRCLRRWRQPLHPEWLMSSQAGMRGAEHEPRCRAVVGTPQGEAGCSAPQSWGCLGGQEAAALSEADVFIIRPCQWLQQRLISRPCTALLNKGAEKHSLTHWL